MTDEIIEAAEAAIAAYEAFRQAVIDMLEGQD